MTGAETCLAIALFFECGICSTEEMQKVADVILSSVESERYEKTICAVVEEPGRFSYQKVLQTIPPEEMPWNQAYKKNWNKALMVTDRVRKEGYAPEVSLLCFHTKDSYPVWGVQETRVEDTKGFYHFFYTEC